MEMQPLAQETSRTPCLCGSTHYNLLYRSIYDRQVSQYSFSLYKCIKCDTVRVFPVPDISLYTDGYTASTAATKEYIPRDKPWCKDLAEEVVELLLKYPQLKGMPVLDVGCNGGELVEQLALRNIEAHGCDVDPVAVNYGLKKKLPLFLCDLATQKLDQKYSVIIMNHTLEHIIPARDMIKNVCSALVQDGLLLIHVPNYDGWIPKIMKHKWGFLAPHEHVWQFTPQTLRQFIENASSSVRAIQLKCATKLENTDGKGWKVFIKKIITSVAMKLGRGDELIAVFKKL